MAFVDDAFFHPRRSERAAYPSIACRNSFRKPRRATVKAGNATTDLALFSRSAMAATAFFRDASFDLTPAPASHSAEPVIAHGPKER